MRYLGVLLAAVLVPACGKGGGGGGAAVPLPLFIQVTPVNPSCADGTPRAFAATGVYEDNSTRDITASVTWTATGATPGTTPITAAIGPISGSSILTVTSATLVSVEVTPVEPTLAATFTLPLAATGIFDDDSKQDLTSFVTWDTANPLVADVSGPTVTGVGAGTTTISATFGIVAGITTITVTSAVLTSIDVTFAAPSFARGTKIALTATGTFDDASTQDLTAAVAWSSDATSTATVDAAGVVTGVAAGIAIITATLGAESDSPALTVTAETLQSITVTPNDPDSGPGRPQQFIATGTFTDLSTQDLTEQVLWMTVDPVVVIVSNAPGSRGLSTGVSPGTTSISANFGMISDLSPITISGAPLSSIDVTPADPTISVGGTQAFVATGNFLDGSTQDITAWVTWSSSNPADAGVSNAAGSEGVAKGVSTGTPTITATADGVSGSTTLDVQ